MSLIVLAIYVSLTVEYASNSFERIPSIQINKCSTPVAIDSDIVKNTLLDRFGPPHCTCFGSGRWRRLAFLNMTNTSQQCPPNWTLQNGTSYRGCSRSSPQSGCDSAVIVNYDFSYNRVCGRVIGYQKGSTDAFDFSLSSAHTIEEEYVDGISLTHGLPGARQHIWTFAAAINEKIKYSKRNHNCQCTNINYNWSYPIPAFVGDHYFCETGNSGHYSIHSTVYSNDSLWDGKQCGPNSSCCQFNNPPWFCASLPESTRDDLELRICTDQDQSDEDVIVSLIEIYVSLS